MKLGRKFWIPWGVIGVGIFGSSAQTGWGLDHPLVATIVILGWFVALFLADRFDWV